MNESNEYYLNPASVAAVELQQLMTNYLLLQLGGQIEFNLADLASLSHTYAGYRFAFEPVTQSITLTLKVRSDEYPAPELGR